MKLLCDVNIPRSIVTFLRREGHLVRWAVDEPPATTDIDLLMSATAANEVVITADKDFGELVFRHSFDATGVILIRLARMSSQEMTVRFIHVWPDVHDRVPARFVTVGDQRVRVRPLPEQPRE